MLGVLIQALDLAMTLYAQSLRAHWDALDTDRCRKAKDQLTGAAWMLRQLGASPILMGLLVFGAIASLKHEVDRNPNFWLAGATPRQWQLLSFVATVVGAIILTLSGASAQLAPFHASGVLANLLFALVSGAVAVWGRDGVETGLSGIGAAIGAFDFLPL